MKHPVLGLEVRRLTGDMFGDVPLDTLEIHRVHAVEPLECAVGDLSVFVAEDRLPAGTVMDAIRRQVPIPEPVIRSEPRQGIPFLGASQSLHGLVSFDGETEGAADRPLEVGTAEPSLDQVIGRPNLHRHDIDFAVAVAREHDDRRATASGQCLSQQIEARVLPGGSPGSTNPWRPLSSISTALS